MPRVPKPRRARTKHYLREWREYRELTQERAMARLGWSQSKISRIESGVTPYNEDDLAAAADAYMTTPAALIEVNPLVEGEVVDLVRLLRDADPERRRVIRELAQNIIRLPTGTRQ
jgi:transcriptional regulator with XRE-family HTH domain